MSKAVALRLTFSSGLAQHETIWRDLAATNGLCADLWYVHPASALTGIFMINDILRQEVERMLGSTPCCLPKLQEAAKPSKRLCVHTMAMMKPLTTL